MFAAILYLACFASAQAMGSGNVDAVPRPNVAPTSRGDVLPRTHPYKPKVIMVGADPKYLKTAKWPVIESIQPWLDDDSGAESALDGLDSSMHGAVQRCLRSHICSRSEECRARPCKKVPASFCWSCDREEYQKTMMPEPGAANETQASRGANETQAHATQDSPATSA